MFFYKLNLKSLILIIFIFLSCSILVAQNNNSEEFPNCSLLKNFYQEFLNQKKLLFEYLDFAAQNERPEKVKLKKDEEAKKFLKLGLLFEEKGRFKDAEEAYIKALTIESISTSLEMEIRKSLSRVISKQKNIVRKLVTYLNSIFPILLIIAALIIIFLIVGLFTSRLNKSIEIYDFNETSEKKYGRDLVETIIALNYQIQTYKDDIVLSDRSSFPLLIKAGNFKDLPHLSARIGPFEISLLDRILKKFCWRPKYKLEGSVHTYNNRVLIFIHIFKRRLKFLFQKFALRNTWEKEFELVSNDIPIELKKRFAYELIFYIMGDKNNEKIRGK